MSIHQCPLCNTTAGVFYTDQKSHSNYFRCPQCDLRFLDSTKRLAVEEEKLRYQLHKNDVESLDFQKFVSPLVRFIHDRFTAGDSGLDFGCGRDPILAHMLSLGGFIMNTHDPLFANNLRSLQRQYNFVVASEVAEHFYSPQHEFMKMRELIYPGGVLGLMTLLCDDRVDFANWHYRRDPTHVVFYSHSTFAWIKNKYQFKDLNIHGDRTVVLSL